MNIHSVLKTLNLKDDKQLITKNLKQYFNDSLESIVICEITNSLYYRFKDNEYLGYIKKRLIDLSILTEIIDIQIKGNNIGNYSLILKINPSDFNVYSLIEVNELVHGFYEEYLTYKGSTL